MVILQRKLKRLKKSLRNFNKTYYEEISMKVVKKRKELDEIQLMKLNGGARGNVIEEERKIARELNELKQAEESYFKQKSRIKWLKEGDQNTKYFHGMMAARQKKNTISVLTDLEGNKLTSYDQISNEAVTFFQKLIGTVDEKVEGCPQLLMKELLGVSLPEAAIPELIRQVTPEEVKSSMFSIGSDKSPGPDGYTSHFFKVAWHIVGEEVVKAVISFFQTSRLIPAFNSTTVALVPKCQNPNNIKEFRPISCCSVVYKCITKIIATRMKKFLPIMLIQGSVLGIKDKYRKIYILEKILTCLSGHICSSPGSSSYSASSTNSVRIEL